VVVCVSEPLTPVIVSAYVPRGVELDVLTVSVEALPVGFGLKEPDALGGRPLTDSVTAPLKPPLGVTVTVYTALEPRGTFCDEGAADSEKSAAAGAVTTSVTVVECVSVGLVPVTVIG